MNSTRSRGRPKQRRGKGVLFILAILAACAGSACSLFMRSGPTPVAQGKYYGSGNPEYDEFFLELYRAQVDMAEVPQKLDSAQEGLAQGLGLSDLPREAMIEHVRVRAREISDGGVIMKMQLSEAQENKPRAAVLLTRPSARNDDVRRLAEPVEKTSNGLLMVQATLEATTARIVRLVARLKDLKSRTDKVFVREGIAKVREVERNLEDADRVLAYMSEQAGSQLSETNDLLHELAQALDTSDGAFERPRPPPEEIAQPERPKKAPARRAPRQTGTPKPAKPKAPQPTASEPAGFEP